jgi:methionyl-tRNA formyltransferase
VTKPNLRLGFAGTPTLAAVVLERLLKHGYPVESVYTRPDRQAGRGRKIQFSPVKNIALQHNLDLMQPDSPDAIDPDNSLSQLDLLIVVAYGMLLPATILHRPRLGCINIHTSLLPRWRGAAPVQRAIEAGDRETGVSIMQMDEGLDTGPVLAQMRCPIAADETSGSLHDKLALLGAECLLETLGKMATGNITPVSQNPALATYANKITKAEARLDWSRPAIVLERQVRAFNPAPVAFTEINGLPFRIWEARLINQPATAKPGTILACDKTGVDIATGDGILRLLKVQPAGKRIMTVQEFLIGRPGFFSTPEPGQIT